VRNIGRFLFLHPAARDLYADWDNQIRGCVARMRALAGTDPDAPDLAALVGELMLKSPDFAKLWERYDVTRRTAAQHKTFHHPHVRASANGRPRSRRARVGGEQVQGPAGDVGGVGAQGFQQQHELRAHGAAGGARRLGCVTGSAGGQGAEVLVLVGVQFQGAGEGVGDDRARPGLLAALEPGVVVDTDPGQRRDLLPAQARGAADPAPGAKPTSAGVT
jgi:hypothetical protein